jgi:mannose-6-phosphate isomerase-like protein (cupin superfamily)
MIRRTIPLVLALLTVLSAGAPAQQVDSSTQIDMYFGDWRASSPRITHGSLEERDILTRGDAFAPPRKGAVLRYVNAFSYATLAPQASTAATRLEGRQEVFYVWSGRGTVNAGGDTADISRNVAVLMPAGLEFTIKNTGSEPLTMYLIDEPVPAGFRPNPRMLVRNENLIPISSTSGFWAHIVKPVFTTADGLGTLESIVTVTLDALTIGRPHLDTHDLEEVWTALEGTSLAFLGTQLRRQGPGVAYMHPPDNLTPHSNINYLEQGQVKFLYFAQYHPHPPRK